MATPTAPTTAAIAANNIYVGTTPILTYTAAATIMPVFEILTLASLTNTDAALTLTWTLTPSGGAETTIYTRSFYKSAPTAVVFAAAFNIGWNLAAGDEIKVYLKSSNAGDTGVTGTIRYTLCTIESALAPSATALLNTTWTDAKAGYLDAGVGTRSTLTAGAQMDLVNSPNATAITAIQSGLALESTLTAISNALASVGLSAEQIAEIRVGLAMEATSQKILEASQAE